MVVFISNELILSLRGLILFSCLVPGSMLSTSGGFNLHQILLLSGGLMIARGLPLPLLLLNLQLVCLLDRLFLIYHILFILLFLLSTQLVLLFLHLIWLEFLSDLGSLVICLQFSQNHVWLMFIFIDPNVLLFLKFLRWILHLQFEVYISNFLQFLVSCIQFLVKLSFKMFLLLIIPPLEFENHNRLDLFGNNLLQ